MELIDFHTHSLLSDGELIPSELARRAEAKGYGAIGIADHVDGSNADFVVPRIVSVCSALRQELSIDTIAGAEITHVPPRLIGAIVKTCRGLGAEFIIVHGETLVEPVIPGTNDAALKAEIDILAHPGLLTAKQAGEAAARGIYLELSGRKGHCLANGLVARAAIEAGAKLIVCSDSHAPSELLTVEEASNIVRGAGLGEEDVKKILQNSEHLLKRIREKRR